MSADVIVTRCAHARVQDTSFVTSLLTDICSTDRGDVADGMNALSQLRGAMAIVEDPVVARTVYGTVCSKFAKTVRCLGDRNEPLHTVCQINNRRVCIMECAGDRVHGCGYD